ncbi:MAG: hypothetical protein V4739_15310 [Pseudomonadota bacterium]
MQDAPLIANPFAMMLNPEAVIQAMERSPKLNRLHSRICRPLDNPTSKKSDDADGPDSQMGTLQGPDGL